MEAEFCVNGSSASNDQQFLGHAAFEAITFTRPPPKKATDASQKCMAISHMPSMKMGSCPPIHSFSGRKITVMSERYRGGY